MVIQPVVREPIHGPTPAYLLGKPTRGTGSGLLIDGVSIISSGGSALVETEKSSDEEWRKMFTAALLGGSSMIVIDNVHRRIEGAAVAAFITSENWSDRKLGVSEKVEVANKALLVFTGNNPRWSDEMDRRLLSIRLDAKMANPERGREFRHPRLKEWVKAHRSELVSAVLVLVQAWLAAGRPYQGATLASFESYSEIIGGILENAGISGFLSSFENQNRPQTSEQDFIVSGARRPSGFQLDVC